MSALLQAPDTDGERDGNAVDRELVAAVRRGDDRAFEALYERYHRRIHAYVFGMVKDHQRAEDVTQDVFVSAVRRMRATERPIAFKPWIYEIAKNACIDQFRRSKRAEEVSFDAGDALAPSDYGRLVSAEPVPDAAVMAKQSLDDLCGAFGGLSDAHHEILVLRELEGLSYREIGERMGMSRPAVESTLFRARRRLTEEYDDLASGARCLRIQSIIEAAGNSRLGARDMRRLARHVAHCQPCRREAVAAGVDAALLARRPVRERVAAKIAALFPFPVFLRGRRGGADGWLHQLPAASDQVPGAAKAAAAVVVLIAGLGVGSQTVPRLGGGSPDHSRGAALERPVKTSAPASNASGHPAALLSGSDAPKRAKVTSKPKATSKLGKHGSRGAARRNGGSTPAQGPVKGARPGTGAGTPARSGGGSTAGGSGSSQKSGGASKPAGGHVKLPAVNLPAAVTNPAETVNQTTQTVTDVTDQVTDTVDDVTSGATAPVTGAVDDTVSGAAGTVGGVVGGVTGGSGSGGVAGTVGGAVGGAGGTVGGAVGGVLP